MWPLLAHVLWPATCLHCAEDLACRAREPLCQGCLGRLAGLEDRAEPGGGATLSLVRAAFPYRDPVVSVVHAFKYAGRADAARWAGGLMARRLRLMPELAGFHGVVPVPLHSRRQRERGYNQARLLAEEVSRAAGLPVLDVLRRRRDTPALWALGRRDRSLELGGAIEALEPLPPVRALVIDDVATTLATLESCARALRRAGARETAGFVLCRQPRNGQGNGQVPPSPNGQVPPPPHVHM